MRKLFWKFLYKFINWWQKVADNNGFTEQVNDCVQMKSLLESCKNIMTEKGLW